MAYGTDQPNPPDSKTDTVTVKVVDDKAVEVAIKRDGKVIEQNKHSVSDDGKTLTERREEGGATTTDIATKQ
jgi:hypothetical protein